MLFQILGASEFHSLFLNFQRQKLRENLPMGDTSIKSRDIPSAWNIIAEKINGACNSINIICNAFKNKFATMHFEKMI